MTQANVAAVAALGEDRGLSATKQSLSAGRKRLLEWMQEINYGRIEELIVQDGEPLLDPLPTVIRKIKIGGESGPRRETSLEDFALKKKVQELFEHLARLGTGVVKCIEVKGGLPFTVEIEEPLCA